MADDILLESGTNEVEILEFFVQGQGMGINVAKISQIIPFNPSELTKIPDESPAILGSLLWQGKTISLIDLNESLKRKSKSTETCEQKIVLVTEFNNVVNGFLCDGVNRIHRIGWDSLDPLSGFLEKHSSMVTGSVHLEGRDILMVDFEYIISELYPETRMGFGDGHEDQSEIMPSREKMKIVFAEDSPFIRTTIIDLLKKAGYSKISSHENGEDALRYIQGATRKAKEAGRDISEYLNLVVSDIEMPQMDGLTLCKNIKAGLGLKKVPVIIFSSLINEQMIQKCREVEANGYTTKPQINELVRLLDENLGVGAYSSQVN